MGWCVKGIERQAFFFVVPQMTSFRAQTKNKSHWHEKKSKMDRYETKSFEARIKSHPQR